MYAIVKPALFALDEEDAHDFALWAAERTPLFLARLWAPQPHANLATMFNGRMLLHPLGLAAGLDKNGVAIDFWEAIGFSFAELGTVTPHLQVGNPRPRLFRYPESSSIINRMGFNNWGARSLAFRLQAFHDRWNGYRLPIGVSIGKQKETPLEEAPADYADCAEAIYSWRPPSYFAINVSSPNTPGLRSLQSAKQLVEIIAAVQKAAPRIPIAVKISPDLHEAELNDIAHACLDVGVSAIIATNTTTSRPYEIESMTETGGLSGLQIGQLAESVTRYLFKIVGRKIPIIGVGGIMSGNAAYQRIRAGASLLQIYTALVYRGPGVVRQIVDYLAKRTAADGFNNISEAVGVDA